MGIFSTILDKLGIASVQSAPEVIAAQTAAASSEPITPSTVSTPVAVASISMVDVVKQMEARAAANPQKLNWRTSIVDLLKLLDMDSSLAARKALAVELYCPDDLMNDSAQMNMWLHKNVLAHIAANGGQLPPDLLK